MEAFGAFLQKLLDNILEIIPFFVTMSYEKSVRWWMGRNPEELGPGIHGKVPWLHHYANLATVDDVLDLPIQSVITKDKKLVCFRAKIGYRVVNVVDHFCNVQDFQTSTIGIATAHLAKRVREETLADLEEDLSKLERSAKGTLETRMKDWGTEITWVGFTDFAEVPTQMRIFGIGEHVQPPPIEYN